MTGEKALIVDQFIRKLTKEGKREKAEIIVKKALEIIAISRAMQSDDKNGKAFGIKSLKVGATARLGEERLISGQKSSRWSRITAVNGSSFALKDFDFASSMNVGQVGEDKAIDGLNSRFWDPLLSAIEIAKPQTTVVATRIAGTAYKVPVALKEKSSRSYAIRWIIRNAQKRSETSMAIRLATEIEEINMFLAKNQNRGSQSSATLKQRDELHKLAETNRAFINY